MKFEVLSERENKFFNRLDLKLLVRHEKAATPAKARLVEELAKKYKVDPEMVVVDYIFTKKGISESTVKAKILREKPKEEKAEKEKGEKKGKEVKE